MLPALCDKSSRQAFAPNSPSNEELLKLNESFNVNLSDFQTKFRNISNSLTVLNINIRSLNTNFTLLTVFLSQLRATIKVIIITESHADDDTVKLYNLNGYKKIFVNRTKFGGGLLVFLHHSLEFNVNPRYTGVTGSYETLFFTLKCPGPPIISIQFLCAYIPHRNMMKDFVQYLGTFPNRILRKNLIIAGDFNVCILRDKNSPDFTSLDNFLSTRNFNQLVEYPTYISHSNNPSILDHMWSNLDMKSNTFVFKAPISDHIPAITAFEVNVRLPMEVLKFRDFSLKKYRLFFAAVDSEIHILRTSLSDLTGGGNDRIDKQIALIGNWTVNKCNSYFPVMKKTVSNKRFHSPWLTSDLVKFINKKHVLFSMLSANQITRETYSLYCKKLKQLLNIRENEFHRNRLKACKFDSGKKWKHINALMGRNNDSTIKSITVGDNSIPPGEEMTEVFHDLYLNLPVDMRSEIPPSNCDFNSKISRNINSFFLTKISGDEVKNVILKLKNNSSLSPIPTKFLKLLSEHFAPILADIFNECIERGHYPNFLKLSDLSHIERRRPNSSKKLQAYSYSPPNK